MELDHVIVFVGGPEAVAPMFPGFVIEQGIRHVGQGTRNRRVVFPRNYVEILWIDDPGAERRSGLGAAARCVRDAECPFGVVLRGAVAEHDRERYVPYRVPGGGPLLLLLAAALCDATQPFVAVNEDGGPTRWPVLPRHPNGVRGVRRAVLRSPTVPDLGAEPPHNVGFERGPARLRLEWDGSAPPRELPGGRPGSA